MQGNITIELKKEMNDPSTFQFVSMGISKMITAGQRKKVMNKEKLKDIIELGMDDYVEQINTEIEFLKNKKNVILILKMVN